MPNSPTLAVVLPNYNHGPELGRSLPALLAQTRAADEWILIDDASQDNSREILTRFARENANVTLLCHETNQGVVASLSEGLRLARSDYIYFASADDIALPDLFARLMQLVEAHPGVGLCLADFYLFSDEHRQIRRLSVCLNNSREFLTGNEFGELLHSDARFHYPPSAAIVRRDTLLKVGGYHACTGWAQDWWSNLRVGLKAGVCIMPEALAGYRVSVNSFSGAGSKTFPDTGKLWQLALTTVPADKLDEFWVCLLAALPKQARRLMWHETLRQTHRWGWVWKHRWRLDYWPALRPWLWPIVQGLARVLLASFYLGALKFFGAAVANNVKIARGVSIDRPWRLRLDAGAVLESGTSICAREPVHIGENAVIGESSVIDASRRDFQQVEADSIIVGPRARLGKKSRVFAGSAIGADAVVLANSTVRVTDATEPARRNIEKVLSHTSST